MITTMYQKEQRNIDSPSSIPVSALDPACFDGLELFAVYKLQYKEAAPEGNAVYFYSR